MAGTTHADQARSLLRFLEQWCERLDRFHAANYRKEVNEFCDHFTGCPVVGQLAQVLFRRSIVSVKEWHERAHREGAVPALPDDPVAAMVFRLSTLRLIRRGKLDLRYFVTNFYPGAHLNAKLMNWKRVVVHPFTADCRAIAVGVTAQLESEWVDLPPLFEAYLDGPFQEEGFGPRAWTDEDDRRVEEAEKEQRTRRTERSEPSVAPAAAPKVEAGARADGDLAGALARLRAQAEAAALSADARHDLLLDLQALALEAERRTLRAERFLSRLEQVARHAALAEACAAVRELLPSP